MKDIDTLLDLPYTRLRWIDAGTFLFQDKVQITFEKGFYAGCYLVTQELYEKVTGENPSHFKGKHRPVERVSLDDAQQFLQRLNEQVKLNDGLQFRLPSETQWEYAARANQHFEYSGSQKLHEVGWFKDNSNDQTMPVGFKEPNAFGLYDMSGNVREWCEDNWNEDVSKAFSNGAVLKAGHTDFRVLRGGSWGYNLSHARVAVRNRNHYYNKYSNNGFRVFRY
ncbi:formylglycine-generating enzyme family protein [Runella sp. SP2]|uniref:formylglycine-generating enzyme family protein n=1 Tax=Runella sp. SP2 TaxID=2268026 RepID=UPI000F081C25|nr:formylglycine-generating enzyme family protein [Runella sp. SP2]AYQ31072.1 formylglycine-generating enzyme family protein [Runella sp. SP2]